MSSEFAEAMNARPLRYSQTSTIHNGYTLCFIRCYSDDRGDTASSANEVLAWCEAQFGPTKDPWAEPRGIQRWGEIAMVMIFVREEDAALFKLTWC
jgi:hypothetical protein